MLTIDCPRCGAKLSSVELMRRGLRCVNEPGCCVTMWELASASSRKWRPLTYLYADTRSGEVKYVGSTSDLPNRLVQDASTVGKLRRGRAGRESTTRGDKKGPSERNRWRVRREVEELLASAGVRVHVSFGGSWWEHWLCTGGAWNKADEGRAPMTEGYRIVRSSGKVKEYEPPAPARLKRWRWEKADVLWEVERVSGGKVLRVPLPTALVGGLEDGGGGCRLASALSLEHRYKRKDDDGGGAGEVERRVWHDGASKSESLTEYTSGELTLRTSGGSSGDAAGVVGTVAA